MIMIFAIEGAITGAAILRNLALILSVPVDLQVLRLFNASRTPLIVIAGILNFESPSNLAATKFRNLEKSGVTFGSTDLKRSAIEVKCLLNNSAISCLLPYSHLHYVTEDNQQS